MSIESRSRQFGKVFDHWQIKEFLGSGSGGKTAVFRLSRVDSSRGASALKVVNLIEERGSLETLSDFRRQEYIAAREECSRSAEQEVWLMDELRGNTNIVDYLDHTFVDWSEENAFGRDLLIRMELLTDLRRELKNGRMFTEEEILKIGRDICAALVRCHSKNILHRDVKPENIFRNKDGDYKLGDFGVSRVLDACPGAVASTGIGTYEYWPAEQMTGSYDKRVDIYSLGLVLYELSNHNRLPFAATSYATGKEVSLRLAGTALPQPMDASPMLAEIILKACAFKPEERYQSAEDFLKTLDWLYRRNQVPANMPESDLPKQETRYETILAQPTRDPDGNIEIASPRNRKPSFETQASHFERSTGGSYLKTRDRRKWGKNIWIPVFLTALVLCAGVGWFAGPRIWAKNQNASSNLLPGEKQLQDEASGIAPSQEQHDNLQETDAAETGETSIPGNEPNPRNLAAAKEQLSIYESPRISSDMMSQLNAGEEVEVLQVKTFGMVDWAYVSAPTRKVMGWIVADKLDMNEILLSSEDTDDTGSADITTPVTESPTDSIKGIQLSLNKKRTFCKGDTLTLDYLTVRAVYQSGKTETLQTGFSVSPSTLNTPGTQTVTVSYGEFTETVDVEVIEITRYSLKFSESGFYKHGDVHWMLSVELAYIGNHRNSGNQYRINGTLRMDGGPNGDIWEDAKKGTAIGMLGEVSPWEDSGVTEYTTYSTYVLPDDPSFGGKHSIIVSIGDVKKTVNFTLTYAGDYTTGTGWELSDVEWT